MQGPPILIVEDSDEDYEAMARALSRAQSQQPLVRCTSGDDALTWLQERSGSSIISATCLPGLIVLDLNLPGTDGREVLREIKQSAHFAMIPVVVFTTSSNPHDVLECYRAGANTYIPKPVDLEKFYQIIAMLYDYWFRIARLPEH